MHRIPHGLPLALITRVLLGASIVAAGLLPVSNVTLVSAACANAVVCENQQAGSPSTEWDLNGGSDQSILGYATDISVNKGDTVHFKINTPASAYTVVIYRLGYYGGNGARKIATVVPSAKLPQTQPGCLSDATSGLVDCGNWAESASWVVPTTAVSGIYIAKLLRSDTGGYSHIVFVVRDDGSHSDLLMQTADTAWQAYNDYGGNSLYTGNPAGRAYKASYNRPFNDRDSNVAGAPNTWLFTNEYPMVRWLEANGYDVTYTTGVDSDRRGGLIQNHKVFMSVGHDEYWSGNQRANVEAARGAGVNLAFFSGNEVFWKTRWEPSIDGTGTANRTLVTYKETHANAVIDPADPPTWTGTWRDPRFSPPADGGRPENGLTGTVFMVNGVEFDPMTVPGSFSNLRFWRNTSVATLGQTQTATFTAGCSCVLGYEWDSDLDNGARPAGLMDLSSTTRSVPQVLQDYGSTYAAGTATHSLTLYRHASGALVFGAGTVDWSWALDGNHDIQASVPEVALQQATVNLFADMHAQPGSLQAGLVPATASTVTTPPSSAITAPTAGATVQSGTPVTITGTATAAAGGVVAGVEVSTDGGSTWHPATGRSSWSYQWTPGALGSVTLRSRAVDDSGNLETPGAGVTVTVQSRACPCTIWPSSATPANPSNPDNAIELGVKFKSDVSGYITGVRFYKGAGNTGTHVGNLWTNSGTLLQSATFSGETATGWQQVNFAAPVAITANTIYVASYHTNVGGYAQDLSYFTSTGTDNIPLHAPANGAVAGGNGVYAYGSTSSFPNNTFSASNYWVDVVFNTTVGATPPPVISGVQATSITSSGASIGWTTDKAADSQVEYGTTTAYGSSTTLDPTLVTSHTQTVSGLSASTVYHYRVKSHDVSGNLTVSGDFTFTTAAPSVPPVISGVQATAIGSTGATIVWNTDKPASSQVDYGTSTAYGSSTGLDSTLVTSHSQMLTGLTANTVYHYRVKSKDSSGNLTVSTDFTFATASAGCPCNLWSGSAAPATPSVGDTSAVELGVKFKSDVNGYVTGVRFYKGVNNTGVHIGNVWTNSGTLLESATFSNETATGWQQVNFSAPIAVTAGTILIASYHTNVGGYAQDQNYFASTGVDNAPLHAPAAGAVSGGNGVYAFGAGSTFPAGTFNASNYWVDVVFNQTAAATQPPVVSGIQASPNNTWATINWTTDKAADSQVDYGTTTAYGTSATLDPTLVTSHSQTLTGLTPSTLYHYRVKSRDVSGNLTVSGDFTFTTSATAICPCNLWFSTAKPTIASQGDASAVEVGVKFKADSNGYITGLRFYKGPNNTGTHVGTLWTSTGASLASATFTNETSSGWQQVSFASPVAVTANTIYVASYHTNVGGYADDQNYFATTGVDNAPLHAPATTAVSGGNGVYTYAANSTFPTSTFEASNYWVDVVFKFTLP